MTELNEFEVTTPPRDAASVVLLRQSPAGRLEVLLMRRHDDSDVLGGAFVFPGGKVDAADAIVPSPAASASRIAPPSALFTEQTTVAGISASVLAPGLPQTGEMHISWICS